MDLAINLAAPNYYQTQQFCDRRLTASAPRKMYGAGTIGPTGWPVGPCQVTANYYFDPDQNDYVLVITKGAASKIIVGQVNSTGAPINVTVSVVDGVAAFKATGKEGASWSLSVVTTDPGETQWALVRADELDAWKADPLAFSPTWIARYAGFKEARFMDWMKTNDNTGTTYPETDLALFNPLTKGVPLSLIVKFALQTGIDPWINIPINATDDAVRDMLARLASLKGKRRPTFELGNEVWNADFKAHTTAISGDKSLWWNAANTTYQAALQGYSVSSASMIKPVAPPTPDGYRWYGYRAAQVSKVIQDAGWRLRDDFNMAVGGQPAQPGTAVKVWEGVGMAGGSGATHFSRWAITGYIWGSLVSDDAVTLPLVRANDLAGGYANLMTVGPLSVAGLPTTYAKHIQIAKDNGGLDVAWYEGNAHLHTIPHYATSNLVARGVTDLTQEDVQRYFGNLCRGDGMAAVMTANLKAAEDAGVKVAHLFNDQSRYGTAGCFGLYGTPAWGALVKWIEERKPSVPSEADDILSAIAAMRAQLDALEIRVDALKAA